MKRCSHLKEFLDSEIVIIKKHIDEHRWFQHLDDPSQAALDFIDKYSFVMRDFYCMKVCEEGGCGEHERFVPSNVKIDRDAISNRRNCSHLEEQIEAEIPVIAMHLRSHQYFQHLASESDTIKDFTEKYGFIMEELYCNDCCKDRNSCKLID